MRLSSVIPLLPWKRKERPSSEHQGEQTTREMSLRQKERPRKKSGRA